MRAREVRSVDGKLFVNVAKIKQRRELPFGFDALGWHCISRVDACLSTGSDELAMMGFEKRAREE